MFISVCSAVSFAGQEPVSTAAVAHDRLQVHCALLGRLYLLAFFGHPHRAAHVLVVFAAFTDAAEHSLFTLLILPSAPCMQVAHTRVRKASWCTAEHSCSTYIVLHIVLEVAVH